jgi:hypothetical protein
LIASPVVEPLASNTKFRSDPVAGAMEAMRLLVAL